MPEEHKSCKELVWTHRKARMSEVKKLWAIHCNDPEARDPEDGNWYEYGLAFDYVAPGTFNGQRRGYWRYQISWGGPSDEFRFFCDQDLSLVRVEYWYMDWFDGACSRIGGRDLRLWEEIWQDWIDCKLPQSTREEAMKP